MVVIWTYWGWGRNFFPLDLATVQSLQLSPLLGVGIARSNAYVTSRVAWQTKGPNSLCMLVYEVLKLLMTCGFASSFTVGAAKVEE
jgi:hypothetical protein